MNKRVYISGKITGLSKIEYKTKFAAAERKLKSFGFSVFNPAKKEIPGFTWEDYMKADIKELCECDFIFLLDDWQESDGAKFEYEVATKLNIPVLEIGLSNLKSGH